jgi:hypothetical protein
LQSAHSNDLESLLRSAMRLPGGSVAAKGEGITLENAPYRNGNRAGL